jgi:hypothetical protein
LDARVQQAVPAGTLRHDGRGSASEKLGEHEWKGMKPKAMALQMTTPTGWKRESIARRKRRFWSGVACQWLHARSWGGMGAEAQSSLRAV